MSLKTLTTNAIKQINETVSVPLTETDNEAIRKIIEVALLEAVNQTTARYKDATNLCCGPDADMAHKIADEMNRAKHALFANLMSMR